MPSLNEIFSLIGLILWNLFKITWWIIAPIWLFSKVQPLYLASKRIKYFRSLDWVLLEISLPPDVIKTPKAMENVFEGFHGIWSPKGGREKWLEGAVMDQFSLEIVGIGGKLHFYVRCQRKQRNFIESKIYSQYSDAEIRDVPDYIEDLPIEVPGPDYDIWGAEYILNRDWAYPIRTYIEFEDIEEERRMDPISQYAELVSKMEEGEYMLMQIVISPVMTEVEKHVRNEVDKLLGRDQSKKYVDPLTSLFNAFQGPSTATQQKPENQQSGIMRMSPGERAALEKMEIKDSKVKFNTSLRAAYVARKDIWRSEHLAGFHGYLRQFNGLNSFRPHADTFPKRNLVLFEKTRNYLRKRKLYTAYKGRYLSSIAKPFVLDTEELATLYHFPGRTVKAPFMPRVPSRTAEPPKGLPT